VEYRWDAKPHLIGDDVGRVLPSTHCMSATVPGPVPSRSASTRARIRIAAIAGACLLAGWLAYARTFHVPFLLDDVNSIVENETIRDLGNLRQVLSPPPEAGPGGRPLANLTLAFNYAWTGLDVWSYHLVNLAIHLSAGLVLFGVIRRTLRQPALSRFSEADTDYMAGAAAALWLLHPIQTIAVTYIAQRTESLASLLYLLTLYSFIRGSTSSNSVRWYLAMIAACTGAIATKETAATAPIVILLYDRTFLAGSFRAAWRQRRGWYIGLASTWLLLAWLMQGLTARGAGLGTGVSPWSYALISCRTLLHYLRLAVWPYPLIFDYGPSLHVAPVTAVAAAGGVAAYVGVTLFALRRSPALGFALAWFLLLLLPTTSFVPVAYQPIAENRMYLPLAGLLAYAVALAVARLGRPGLLACLSAALALGAAAFARNDVYRDDLTLWADTARKRPENGRAHTSLGKALVDRGRIQDALPHFETAVRVAPRLAGARNNLGNTLLKLGRTKEALAQFKEVLMRDPDNVNSQYDAGNAFLLAGEFDQAARAFARALQLKPNHAFAAFSLGNAERELGHPDAAIAAYEKALRIQPKFEEVHRNLGAVLTRAGRSAEGLAHLEQAVQLQPEDARAEFELGYALALAGRMAEAEARLKSSIARAPNAAEAQNCLGLVLADRGDVAQALEHIRRAIQLQPDYAQAHNNYASLLARVGRLEDARAELETAIRLQPNYTEARENLARINQQLGR
jgi:protein O-mannosyl-transferase